MYYYSEVAEDSSFQQEPNAQYLLLLVPSIYLGQLSVSSNKDKNVHMCVLRSWGFAKHPGTSQNPICIGALQSIPDFFGKKKDQHVHMCVCMWVHYKPKIPRKNFGVFDLTRHPTSWGWGVRNMKFLRRSTHFM